MPRLTLALDVMGGDFGPSVTVPAALRALAFDPRLTLLLVGDTDAIAPYLARLDPSCRERVRVVASESVIAANDPPSSAIRRSKGSSMRMAIELVVQGEALACVSAGNTGALLGLAMLLLKPLAGIDRPALMTVLPTQQQGKTVLLDLGANVNCTSQMLVQFAIMGTVFAEEMLRIDRPKVALLNIGEEESKGIASIRDAAAELKTLAGVNYLGYLEGNALLSGKADVLVCDGFTGNMMLKTMEGMLRLFLSLLKPASQQGRRPWWWRLAKRWLQWRFFRRFRHLNPDQYNGACLLGLKGVVVKSHGSANQLAFTMAIKQALQAVERQVPLRIASRLEAVLPKNGIS